MDLVRENAIAQLNAALELISDKSDYLTALQVAPQLVVTESNPYRFLRCADFNTWAAAQALVAYWKRRREIFGDRCFLPMTIAREGALTQQDIEFIKAGSMAFLPRDAQGRTVLCVDTRRMDFPVDVRLRTGFYIHSVLSENEVSQTKGHVVLVLVRKLDQRTKGPNIRSLIMPVFPLRKPTFHIFNCLPYWPSTGILGAFMEGLARFFNDLLLQHQTSVHASQRGEELISCMEASGFRKEGLPACIGGSWNYAYFSQWLADRIRLERDRYKLFYPASASTSNPAPSSDPEEDHPLKKRRIHYSPTNNSINNDTGQGMQGSRDQTQELGQLVEQLPNANAFKDARRSAPPEIWTFESNLEAFLRVENFDSQQAAKRVAQYWSLRAKYFGPKRFEPLHQTGEAALRRKDLSILITGFITLLPNDADGCAVLWIDGSRLPEGSVDANRDRCLFYMFSLLAETEQSQKEGAVLLYRMDDSSTVSNIPSDVLEQLASSLPIRFKAVHLVSQRPISSDITASMSFGNHLYIHIGTSKEELSHKLETFGLRKENLPRYLNGDWGYSKFIQWQELRTRMEWRVPLGLSGREASLARFPTLRPFDALPDAEREERSRRLNVMHCRRKKYRILVETDLLREQAKELEDEQEELQKENKKLQELLLKAIALEQELVDKTK